MPHPSKTKGNTAERELCRILSEALGGSFVRTPGSGAFVGGLNASRITDLSAGQVRGRQGDVIPPDELSNLVVESKACAAFPWHQLLSGSCPTLDRWIEQANCGVDTRALVLVAFRPDRQGWHVAAPGTDWNTLSATVYRQRWTVARLDDWLALNADEVRGRSAPSSTF